MSEFSSLYKQEDERQLNILEVKSFRITTMKEVWYSVSCLKKCGVKVIVSAFYLDVVHSSGIYFLSFSQSDSIRKESSK
jgi:hypothetical protein